MLSIWANISKIYVDLSSFSYESLFSISIKNEMTISSNY